MQRSMKRSNSRVPVVGGFVTNLATLVLVGFTTLSSAMVSADCSLNAASIEHRADAHQDSISKYADKYGVDQAMVKAVIAVESCYNTAAVSPKGAQGLMQLIPETAARFGVDDSLNSSQNIYGGTRYLSWLMKRYDGDLYKAIAAYNAGEGAVDKYQGIPPYNETQHYVRKVLTAYNRLSGQAVALPAVTTSTRSTVTATKIPTTTVAMVGGAVVKRASVGGRVSAVYQPPKLGMAKPGRAGWQANKALAPELFKH